MSNNFSNTYQRTMEWDTRADRDSGMDGKLVSGSSTFNNDIGYDIDYQVLSARPIPGNNNYREIQTLDYDVLKNPLGNGSASIDTSCPAPLSETRSLSA